MSSIYLSYNGVYRRTYRGGMGTDGGNAYSSAKVAIKWVGDVCGGV